MDAVLFYSVNEEYGEFTNFAPYEILAVGRMWKTVEHYFQAQKFADAKQQSKIKNANSPMLAASYGRDRKQKLRKDWESVKISIMRCVETFKM